MGSQVAVSLLVTVVLWDVVEVVPSDDDGTVHLCRDNSPREDTATDGDETSEWALLVYARTKPLSIKIRTTRLQHPLQMCIFIY